jgi:hypothetical protein
LPTFLVWHPDQETIGVIVSERCEWFNPHSSVQRLDVRKPILAGLPVQVPIQFPHVHTAASDSSLALLP